MSRPVPPVPPTPSNRTPEAQAEYEKAEAAWKKERAEADAAQASKAREARLNAKAWEIFVQRMSPRDLDGLGEDDITAEGARKRITSLACNALEAAEIFVETVEE